MITEQLYYLGNKALIRNNEGKLLLLHDQRNPERSYWDLPGGRVNKGEDVITALKRELQEETGLTQVTIGKHVGIAVSTVEIPISEQEKGGLIFSIYSCSAPDLSILTPEPGVTIEWCEPDMAIEQLDRYPEQLRAAIKAELEFR